MATPKARSPRRRREQHGDLDAMIARLEALHMLALRIDACQAAAGEVFHRMMWRGPGFRRDLNRLDYFLEGASSGSAELLVQINRVVADAMRLLRQPKLY